jgi:hypothetical protein
MSLLDWATRIDHFYAAWFGVRKLKISVAHARMKIRIFDIETISPGRISCR